MEVLSPVLMRAREEAFILGFKMGGVCRKGIEVSHLLFTVDTLVFCNSNQEHMEHLSWAFM